MIQIKGPRDFAAGCTFILIALFYLWFGRNLSIGSSSFMEAGYFPRLAAVALALFGAIIAIRAIAVEGPELESWAWRPLLILTGCVVLFGLIITRAGLVLTTVLVVVAMSFAGGRLSWKQLAGFVAALVLFMVGLFHFGLGLAIPVWPR